jgi:hypothetical protein
MNTEVARNISVLQKDVDNLSGRFLRQIVGLALSHAVKDGLGAAGHVPTALSFCHWSAKMQQTLLAMPVETPLSVLSGRSPRRSSGN